MIGITLWEEVLDRLILKEGPRTYYSRHMPSVWP